MLQGSVSRTKRTKAARHPGSAVALLATTAVALSGCSGSSSSALRSSAGGANAGQGGPVCGRIESAWAAFASPSSADEADYGKLGTSLSDALTSNQNLQLAEDDFNLSADAANISASGLSVPASFLSDVQAVAKDCGTTLSLPGGATPPQPKP